MMALLTNLRLDRRGATAMEYGLIAALVSIAAAGVMGSMGVHVKALFVVADTPVAAAATAG